MVGKVLELNCSFLSNSFSERYLASLEYGVYLKYLNLGHLTTVGAHCKITFRIMLEFKTCSLRIICHVSIFSS